MAISARRASDAGCSGLGTTPGGGFRAGVKDGKLAVDVEVIIVDSQAKIELEGLVEIMPHGKR